MRDVCKMEIHMAKFILSIKKSIIIRNAILTTGKINGKLRIADWPV